MTIDTDHGSDSDRSDIRIEVSYIGSTRRYSSKNLNFEETLYPDVTVIVSDMDININLSDQSQFNIAEKNLVTPSMVLNIESIREEVEFPDINVHLSNKDIMSAWMKGDQQSKH